MKRFLLKVIKVLHTKNPDTFDNYFFVFVPVLSLLKFGIEVLLWKIQWELPA